MSQFECPTCGFVQGYATLHAADGSVSDNPGPAVVPPCPNDGTALVPLSEDEAQRRMDADAMGRDWRH